MKKLNSSIGVDILVNGKPLQTFKHDGKIFIEGRNGSEYEILISNNSYKRILVIPSVDGLNCLNSEEADSQNGVGYVLEKFQNFHLKGFRINNEKVASFLFSKKDKSYANKIGADIKNCGVIGISAFFEYQETQPKTIIIKEYIHYNSWPNCPPAVLYYHKPTSDVCCQSVNFSNSLQNSLENVQDSFSLGTEFGKAKVSKVIDVEFKKGEYAGQTQIFYATRELLLNMGVPLERVDKVCFPDAYPKQFCSLPFGWKDK